MVAVAPVELEWQVRREVFLQLLLGLSQFDTQFIGQLVAQCLVHIHAVAFHFDGRNEGTELQHQQAAHAFLLCTGKLLEEHVAGNTNVTLASATVGQVLAQQVAGQQVRVNVRCVDACFPQLLHLVNLEVFAVAQGQLVHAEHVALLVLPFHDILSKLQVPDQPALCDVVHPRLERTLVLADDVEYVELDVLPH